MTNGQQQTQTKLPVSSTMCRLHVHAATFKSILQKESDEIQPVTQCCMFSRAACGVIENSSVLFYFMMMDKITC